MSRPLHLLLCGALAGLALARWPDAWPGVALALAFVAAWPHLAALATRRAAGGRHCTAEGGWPAHWL